MIDYDLAFTPPAPVLDVQVIAPLTGDVTALRGQIDTGTSISVLPWDAVGQLALIPVGKINVRGYAQRIEQLPTFLVTLKFQGFVAAHIEVTAVERADMLIGRDVLQFFTLILDGPARKFSIRA